MKNNKIDDILIIGMPAGSLANASRGGNLIKILENAGFNIKGYDAGGPSNFVTHNYIIGWDGRPQEFGAQLGINEIDVAISGDDWIKERQLELSYEYNTSINLEKVLALKRGEVKIVAIIDNNDSSENKNDYIAKLAHKDIIFLASEMPYMALEWIHKQLKELGMFEKYSKYSVQKYKTPPKIKEGIVIYETWGKTESKVKNHGVDIGIEITQSGSALKNYNLRIIDTLMLSEASIWVNSNIRQNKNKFELLQLFLINLYGAVNAENKVMILFNVANIYRKEIDEYLKNNYLFADEPTINIGHSFTEYSIQIDVNDNRLPLAKIRYELAKRKAVNINTIPIISSIQSIDTIEF
jgi:ATP phosphoribosyltransferase